jgi:hypothetical protein
LAATKYWPRQNIGGDKILAPTEMFASTEIIGVNKMLASKKFWCRQNTHVDKMLAWTKYSRQRNAHVNKILTLKKCWRRRWSISLLFGLAPESTAADFSQTSLMFSFISQTVLIPPHAVTKCGIATAPPAFMGGLSPTLYRLVVPAHHAKYVTNIGVDKILASAKILLIFA